MGISYKVCIQYSKINCFFTLCLIGVTMSYVLYFSSGNGPTAVIIALDALYKHGLVTGVINIQEFASKMRNDRIGMIQNLVTAILSISGKINIWD